MLSSTSWIGSFLVQVLAAKSARRNLVAPIRSHDFNNLLTVILGFTELIAVDASIAGQHSMDLEEIGKAAGRAAGLTKQLLAFSRQQVLHATPLDVNGVITDMTGLLARLIGENIKIALRLAPTLSVHSGEMGYIPFRRHR
jgi:signal transduction histidine kinase